MIKKTLWAICIIVISSLLIWRLRWELRKDTRVAGKYGRLCYVSENRNKAIEIPVYFDSYSDCIYFVEH